ncbi:MAG: ribosomal protein S18-alanine N-acetyltransferase [Gammaproteobacteria bacterium]|nr:ribosomal protein S18-alanine N-acetyltransferase [Gammaproteobacteria bacterium]
MERSAACDDGFDAKVTPYTLSELTLDDLPQMVLIESLCYDFGWSEKIFADCLTTGREMGYRCWKIEVAQEMAGYLIFQLVSDEATLLNVALHPGQQGKGVGKMVVEEALRAAGEGGATRFYLEVRPSNRRAIDLYLALGFVKSGLRRDYYPAAVGREDALLLTKPLEKIST